MREIRAEAPGRVNLIGEHTDYHDGYVLPCAVPQRTFVTLRPREDLTVHAVSRDVGPAVTYEVGAEQKDGSWGDYVKGVTSILLARGHRLRGFHLDLRSDVPPGSGLSSSAALEIAVLRALRKAFDLPLDDQELARVGQRAEVEFVGAPVGIMDQMASSFAGPRAALFLDTRTLEHEQIPLPPSLDLVVLDSGVAHQHAGGDYVTRRRESEEAAALLGVGKLRDADLDRLGRTGLPDRLERRARHVITENVRVVDAVRALRAADLVHLGCLFNTSHVSLRDDYEVSVPAVDLLVGLAQAEPDVFGARMTGGGFGGAMVAAVRAGAAAGVARRVGEAYEARTGRPARVLLPETTGE